MAKPKMTMIDPALYKSLRTTESVDVVVYGRRRFCNSNELFLEDGRPRALDSINISTWSLLSSSIKEYCNGLLSYSKKFIVCLLSAIYLVIFLPGIVFPDLPSYAGFWIAEAFMMSAFVVAVFVIRHYIRKYMKDEFHPAVQRVVDELRPAILDCGFDVEYIVRSGWTNRSFLRFIHKEDCT